ncbi:hypothetical protein BIW11_03387 [Tropilaelaps mercedesae]|uniref:Uncharacterized protein n=1 Tax=Tropilaelaps mercedesae TaxID=418985 RepID=A0A1V9XMP3_9ACAR|nr:hypothetical protein BIW11_03387 [Tropilaelaps mercedesae]
MPDRERRFAVAMHRTRSTLDLRASLRCSTLEATANTTVATARMISPSQKGSCVLANETSTGLDPIGCSPPERRSRRRRQRRPTRFERNPVNDLLLILGFLNKWSVPVVEEATDIDQVGVRAASVVEPMDEQPCHNPAQ